jgi:hypothetical protein
VENRSHGDPDPRFVGNSCDERTTPTQLEQGVVPGASPATEARWFSVAMGEELSLRLEGEAGGGGERGSEESEAIEPQAPAACLTTRRRHALGSDGVWKANCFGSAWEAKRAAAGNGDLKRARPWRRCLRWTPSTAISSRRRPPPPG